MITDMDRPNGICFSPDESLLYVVDVGQIRVYDMDGGRPVNGRVFVAMNGFRRDPDRHATATCGPRPAGVAPVSTACTATALRANCSGRSICPRHARTSVRRGQEEPAVHDREPFAVQRLRQHPRNPIPLASSASTGLRWLARWRRRWRGRYASGRLLYGAHVLVTLRLAVELDRHRSHP